MKPANWIIKLYPRNRKRVWQMDKALRVCHDRVGNADHDYKSVRLPGWERDPRDATGEYMDARCTKTSFFSLGRGALPIGVADLGLLLSTYLALVAFRSFFRAPKRTITTEEAIEEIPLLETQQ